MTKKENKEVVIISVGGSMIFPEEINTSFLSHLKDFVLNGVKKGKRFVIVCGGGKICRKYQHAALEVTKLRPQDVDWLGIHSTRLNAQLVKAIFLPKVEEVIIHDPFDKKVSFTKPILIGAGWKPGWSTDFVSVCLAKRFKAKKLINLTNIDYIFDKDPREFKDAKRIEEINWKEFRKLIPKKWDPGLSSPFDPIASKEAEVLGLQVAIINGNKLEEADAFINGKNFVGSIIKP